MKLDKKLNVQLPLFLLIIILKVTSAFSQTIVGGVINTNTTWTKTKSPYLVKQNIMVMNDITLKIEPGVKVIFDEGIGISLREARLLAIGTVTDSIIFTSNRGNWEGITFKGETFDYQQIQIEFRFVKSTKSNYLINYASCGKGTYLFRNSSFINNLNVFIAHSGWCNVILPETLVETLVDSCYFAENGTCSQGFTCKSISNSILRNNNVGISTKIIDRCTITGTENVGVEATIVTNNIITNNRIAYVGEPEIFTNNIVVNNVTGLGLLNLKLENPGIQGNKICNSVCNISVGGNTVSGANLRNNCFCNIDAGQMEDKIYDGKDALQFPFVNVYQNDCSDTVIIKPIVFCSISGYVHAGSGVMTEGLVSVINSETGKEYNQLVNPEGYFMADSLPIGQYIIKAIPKEKSYSSTYYPNKVNKETAATLKLEGVIDGVDIFLQFPTGLVGLISDGDLSFGPNPFNENLCIESKKNFIIRNSSGIKIYQSDQNNQNIDTSQWPVGLYFIMNENGNVLKLFKN